MFPFPADTVLRTTTSRKTPLARGCSRFVIDRPSRLPIGTPPPRQKSLEKFAVAGCKGCPDNNINNYLVECSFCDNWTEESLVHFPVRCPAAGSISAGDHYFKWCIKGRSLPLCTVTFSILPFVDAENPICYCNTSSRTGALNCYILFYTVPGHLPEQIENTLFDIGDQGNGCNTAAFVNFLQDFCTSFY